MLVLLWVFSGSGCVIGEIIPVFPLDPPLGLTAKQNSTNSVFLEWWGNNRETYFSGYVIFLSTNLSDISNNISYSNHLDKPFIKNSSGNLPTVIHQPTTLATKYSYVLNTTPNGSSLTLGTIYYIAVAAYSSSKGTFSPLSNITNFILTN